MDRECPIGRRGNMSDEIETFFREWVKPRAGSIDRDLGGLKEALEEMARRGYLGLKVPPEAGGRGFSGAEFRKFQQTVARASGALAFLESQHQSACAFLAQSENKPLREKFLRRMGTGEVKVGIAFSQLRRTGEPALKVSPREGEYVLDGKLPWVTGWGIFDRCVTAGTLEDGKTIFLMHELREGPHLKASAILSLAAVEVAQTVSLEVTGLVVPEDDVLYVRPGTWIQENDKGKPALQSPLALGCAQAGIDVMRGEAEKKGSEPIRRAADALEAELGRCESEIEEAIKEREDTERALQARAWAIELAGRCAHAGVVSSSGAGNQASHPAQRVFREALAFTVLSQTRLIQEATLARLTKPSP